MTPTLLIDGDITAYQKAASIERPIKWDEDLWTLHASESEGIRLMEDHFAWLKEELEAESLEIVLTDSAHNWRHDVLPTYKENRKNTRKPVCLKAMRDHLLVEWGAWLRPGLEGDDVLGLLQTSPKILGGDKIIVSIDKDFRTVPGKILNLNHAREKLEAGEIESLYEAVEYVSVEQADAYHLYQTLIGDTTDGYKGCPGIGPVKAKAILGFDKDMPIEDCEIDDVPSAWDRVVEAFKKAKLGEKVALQQARVARIVRREDYDFKNKEVILWNPT